MGKLAETLFSVYCEGINKILGSQSKISIKIWKIEEL